MSVTFGRFMLDVHGRSLRLDGRDRPLQPLVFDLLVYLVEHRDRVVPKEELLERLWEDSTVTDGSLQRAISLLRGALREGGMEDAIQTFARRGYRFCEGSEATTPESKLVFGELEARTLADSGHWDRALEAFRVIPDQSVLSATDFEAWGRAAMCAGRPELSFAPLEQAVAAFERSGDREGAARVALLLTNVKLEGREFAVASGWHERAQGYLRGLPEGKQHGFSEWLSSRLALFEGRLEESRAYALAALEIAGRVDDPDLHWLGLVYHGHLLIAQGEVRRGLSLHDEAGAATLAGRVSPWVSGLVFCSVIWAYLHLGDHHRAGQWTDQFTRWCERHASYCYPALCRLHRAEILAVRGELTVAEEEARRAREALAVVGPFCEGDACRVLGEVLLARGDLDGAEHAFREAHRLGWNPQPGLALLLAARGEANDALQLLERALLHPTWSDAQRRGSMLAVLSRIAARSGQLERARAALAELDSSPERRSSRAVELEISRAEAELAWAAGDLIKAEVSLRASVTGWLQIGAHVHAADARLRLCELLVETGDTTSADLELGSAETAFRRAGAEHALSRCRALRGALSRER